jgi:AcrR family transcriptional regulator
MRQDLRVRRTRKLIWDALLALLDRKSFEAISVQEICDRAMVHRTTFYQHYEDKYDLLRKGTAILIGELLGERLDPIEAVNEASLEQSASLFVPILKHVGAKPSLYRTILINDRSGAYALLRDAVAEQTLPRLALLAQSSADAAVPPPIIARYSADAILGLVAWWVENDLRYSAEEMARYIILLITRGSYGALKVTGAVARQ